MYSSGQVLHGLRNPALIKKEVNKLYYRRANRWQFNEAGIDVFAADWDNLLILDACRYDLFAERHTLPGRLEPRESRGSSTEEFLQANFGGRTLHDVVYVTANPQLFRKEIDTSLYAVRHVWQDEGWDDHARTVLPETMTAAARQAAREFPHKRLVVHYMQPHYPFIGETGRSYFDLESLAFWDRVERREIDVPDEIIERAYAENFELLMPHLQDLMGDLTGKTVVTADHGQLMGDRAGILPHTYYGHPSGIYHEGLVRVPWLVHEGESRRDTIAEPPRDTEAASAPEELVTDRLRSLGYVK